MKQIYCLVLVSLLALIISCSKDDVPVSTYKSNMSLESDGLFYLLDDMEYEGSLTFRSYTNPNPTNNHYKIFSRFFEDYDGVNPPLFYDIGTVTFGNVALQPNDYNKYRVRSFDHPAMRNVVGQDILVRFPKKVINSRLTFGDIETDFFVPEDLSITPEELVLDIGSSFNWTPASKSINGSVVITISYKGITGENFNDYDLPDCGDPVRIVIVTEDDGEYKADQDFFVGIPEDGYMTITFTRYNSKSLESFGHDYRIMAASSDTFTAKRSK